MKTGLFVLSLLAGVAGVGVLLAWAGTSVVDNNSLLAGLVLLCLSGVLWLLGRRAGGR